MQVCSGEGKIVVQINILIQQTSFKINAEKLISNIDTCCGIKAPGNICFIQRCRTSTASIRINEDNITRITKVERSRYGILRNKTLAVRQYIGYRNILHLDQSKAWSNKTKPAA